ncbi:MAG: SRPBCC domain-containing protein [Leptospira sp.]|nr:SRPBCC domain-containing protein [Leptospira sp.]
MKNEQLEVKCIVSADVKKVWDYYTSPEHITKWNFADPSWHCPNAENDLRPGGKYFARMEARDGSFGFDFIAFYDEVLVKEKLVYTMGDGRKAIVTFTNLENKTEVIVKFDAENENPKDMQIGGWQSILNSFKEYVEAN